DKIYLEKARRIIGVNEPSKLLKSLIFSDYQSIVENRKRWREIRGLYVKALSPKGKGEGIYDKNFVVVGKTDKKLQTFLDTKANDIYLSGWTIRTHTHHDNIGAFDYYLVPHMLSGVYKTKESRKYHIVYFAKLGNYYRAVFKKAINDEGEEE
ncbi:hypothetical protein, partial [Helicobacter sp. 12S02634-8]|uniref:hypothetical protein n=1 Tax=Helicobacter sp. 12S02634-8 TaxID=1476199 RepID=UPI001551B750